MSRSNKRHVITNMGTSHNSHGTKSDKETQSPLLKVFKDIMTKEKNDPEKRNLLPYQNDEKKRKHYSGTRAKKVNRKSSEVNKVDIQQSQHGKNNPYQQYSEQRTEFPQNAATEAYPATETKDSGWWNFTKDIKVCDMTSKKQKPPEPQDDTCSCTSCALKRILTDYCGVVCLSLLFVISLVAVFCFVCANFKSDGAVVESAATDSLPTDPLDLMAQKQGIADSERMKRRIEALQAKGGENGNMMKDEEGVLGKPRYDSIRSDPMDLSGSADIDLRSSLRELDGLQGYSELPSLMNPTEVNMQSSDKLREFYKKLAQTDAKLKTLKRLTSNENENFMDSLGFDMNTPDRTKRSLKLLNYPKRFKIRRFRIDGEAEARQKGIKAKNSRLKRSRNNSDNAAGFIIEKKKFVFQFKPKPGKKLVAKCSHMPKDSHSHEHQLKHPYYQNSERLDQMLDKFFNKNLPDSSDPFNFEDLFQNVKKCKHLKSNKHDKIEKVNKKVINKNLGFEKKYSTVQSVYQKGDKNSEVTIDSLDDNILSHEPISILESENTENNDLPIKNENKLRSDKSQTTSYENSLLDKVVDMMDKEKQAYVTVSPTGYDILLSISTVINPYVVKTSLHPNFLVEKIPNLRHLMQTEEEDSIAYEDFKEVLTDSIENQDEVENGRDRKKRDNNIDDNLIEVEPDDRKIMFTPVSVNPNWKGPMPLYPDEIGSMMNQANDVNKLTPTLESNIKPTHISGIKDVIQDNIKPSEDTNIKAGEDQAKAAQDIDDKVKSPKPIARPEQDISDEQYSENYEDMDNFVEMAQAYSDYGVLEEKKYSRNEKNPATDAPYLRIQLSGNGEKYFKRGIVSRENSVRGIFSLFPKKEDLSKKTSKINTDHYNKATEPKINNNKITKIFSLTTPRDKNIKLKNVFVSTIISTLPNNYAKDTRINDFMGKNMNSKLDTSNKMNDLENDVNNTIYNNIMWPNIDEKNKRNANKNDELLNIEEENAPSVSIAKDPIIGNSELLKYVSKVTQSNFDMFNASQFDLENPQNEVQMPFMNNVTTINVKSIETDVSSAFEKPNSSKTESENNVEEPEYDSQYLDLDNSEAGIDSIGRQFDIPFVVNFNENEESNLLFEDEFNIKDSGYNFDDITTAVPKIYEVSKADTIHSSPEHFGIKKRVKRNVGTTETQPLNRAESNEDKSDFKSVANNNVTTHNNYTSNNNITLGDFFMMISDWFKTLEGVNVDDSKRNGNRSSDITELLLLLNNDSNETKPNIITSTTEGVYPLYDSDMIENIGHRSRVLLSFKDENETHIKENVRINNGSKDLKVTESKNGNMSATKLTNAPTKLNTTNATRNIEVINRSILNTTKKHDANKKVKRNADDSNMIFWNDMYDDEYGIQNDHLDKIVKDKDRKENYFMKRSEKWVHDKIKKLTSNFKGIDAIDLERRNRMPREATNIGIIDYPKYYYNKVYDKLNKREIENENRVNQKSMFDLLNAKMARVCRNAAEAVQKTRNAEAAKTANKESNAASSMMQKLIRILTDLVDYQVEQNTCAKLPPDLRSFLEWLTEPEGSKDEQKNSGFGSIMNDYIHRRNYHEQDQHRNVEYDITKANKENINDVETDKIDTKAHVLETARSIQDLLDDYEEMNDEDKMKVTGVKFYLENQLRHLNKNYAFHDELNPFNRSPSQDMEIKVPTLRRRRSFKKLIKELANKFTTKTTTKPNHNSHITVTKILKDIEDKVSKVETVFKCKDKTRNLQDVYYEKPITTAKEVKKGVLDNSENTDKKHQILPTSKHGQRNVKYV